MRPKNVKLVNACEQLSAASLSSCLQGDFHQRLLRATVVNVIIAGTHLYSCMQVFNTERSSECTVEMALLAACGAQRYAGGISLKLPMQRLFAHMPLSSTLQPAELSVKSSSQCQSSWKRGYFNPTVR